MDAAKEFLVFVFVACWPLAGSAVALFVVFGIARGLVQLFQGKHDKPRKPRESTTDILKGGK